jgi:predicted deacetylase
MSPSEPTPRALVSVHDLLPATMPAVRRTLALLEHHAVHPITLLVVPGSGWDAAGIDELRALERAGYRLAGHGWQHRAPRIRGLRHRLHSLFLSRNVAEHLSLDRAGVLALMRRCRAWFESHGLNPPALYVPPAWALGDVGANDLRRAGLFRQVEVFSGVLDVATGRLAASPVLGYEADAALRVPVLRLWNALGRRRATTRGWVRIGIHPGDIDHPLRVDLEADLTRFRHFADYADVLADTDNRQPGGRIDSGAVDSPG